MPKNTWATAGQSEATQACKFIRLRLQAVITTQLDLSHMCESKTPTSKRHSLPERLHTAST